MAKDRRYTTVRNLIAGGYIKTFREIFDTLPKSVVAGDLRINNNRFTRLMENVHEFTLEDLFTIASLLEIENSKMLELVLNQYHADKRSRRSPAPGQE
jgi:hypothetical protein